jgi:hypothetical protein
MPRKKLEELETPVHAEPASNEPASNDRYVEEGFDSGVSVEMGKNNETKKVKLDLEVDTSVKDLGPNPFVWLIHLAKAVDAWRIFPRIFISVYIILLYQVVNWFMMIDNPTMEQSGLVSIIVGAGAAWFGLYVGSGSRKK